VSSSIVGFENEVETIQEINASISYANQWQVIPVSNLTPIAQNRAHRLNSLGSSFYFIKVALKKGRLKEHLHKNICDSIERTHLKEVLEIPRDHFKTTICSEGMPMFWALPFTYEDEKFMRVLGYGDEWIEWMYHIHNPNTRTLTVSENKVNACKIGKKIDSHFKNNRFFTRLFPEIVPDGSCNWSVETMTQKRDASREDFGQGEGTYEYLGVDGALQSRHYNRVIQDDLVGKEALNSEIVMNSTIDYHRLMAGAFDSDPNDPNAENDEIVVGNRWSYKDLNYWIRKNEPSFRFTTHSALGGCCPLHPPGFPIFPEEWSIHKLNKFKERFGTYFFSCQFLNTPTPPGDTKFKVEYLNRFTFKTVVSTNLVQKPIFDHASYGDSLFQQHGLSATTYNNDKRQVAIQHEVKNGQVIKDILPIHLQRNMLIDPNHAGEEGRCNHALIVTGFNRAPIRIYLLDLYAKNSSHADLVHKIFEYGEKWKIREPHLETVGAQKWLKYHLEVENKTRKSLGKFHFYEFKEFKKDSSRDAKIHRIESLEPMFQRKEFWMLQNGQEQFQQEYLEYPYAPTRDILDVLGYAPSLWNIEKMDDKEVQAFMDKGKRVFRNRSRNASTGY